MNDKEAPMAWVVVQVAAGIPVSVVGFMSEKAAHKHELKLRKEIHPESGETGVFPLVLSSSNESNDGL